MVRQGLTRNNDAGGVSPPIATITGGRAKPRHDGGSANGTRCGRASGRTATQSRLVFLLPRNHSWVKNPTCPMNTL